MPKLSINILTKNRAGLLKKALESVKAQSFKDFQVELISDGSIDRVPEERMVKELQEAGLDINFVFHSESLGITLSRKEALEKSAGEYVAVLDDDDEWVDPDKLKKQVEFLDSHSEVVLVGGGIKANDKFQISNFKFRPETDGEIRNTMLFRNNFFTSTVMFRKNKAAEAGGFIKDDIDFVEDYDLWLRIGEMGKMYNFQEVFTAYRSPSYNKDKFKQFLRKQLVLIKKHQDYYPWYVIAAFILKLRLIFKFFNF